jgi:hypothetical protein
MFEESKIWFLVIIFAALIGIGYGSYYLTTVDETNLMLQESKSKLASTHEALTELTTSRERAQIFAVHERAEHDADLAFSSRQMRHLSSSFASRFSRADRALYGLTSIAMELGLATRTRWS